MTSEEHARDFLEYVAKNEKRLKKNLKKETIQIKLLVVNFGKKKIVIEDYKTLFINI